MRRECWERLPHHRGLAIPTCITARAWRTCRDACRDRYLEVSFEVSGGKNVPGIPGACATHNFTYLARGPCRYEYSNLVLNSSLWFKIHSINLGVAWQYYPGFPWAYKTQKRICAIICKYIDIMSQGKWKLGITTYLCYTRPGSFIQGMKYIQRNRCD